MGRKLTPGTDKYGNRFLKDESGQFAAWLSEDEERRENPSPDNPEESEEGRYEHFRAANPHEPSQPQSTMASPTDTATEAGSEALDLLKSNASMIILGDFVGAQASDFIDAQLEQYDSIPSWLQETARIGSPALLGGLEKAMVSNTYVDGIALGHAITTIKMSVGKLIDLIGSEGSANGSENGSGDQDGDMGLSAGYADKLNEGTDRNAQLEASYAPDRSGRNTGAGQTTATMAGT